MLMSVITKVPVLLSLAIVEMRSISQSLHYYQIRPLYDLVKSNALCIKQQFDKNVAFPQRIISSI